MPKKKQLKLDAKKDYFQLRRFFKDFLINMKTEFIVEFGNKS